MQIGSHTHTHTHKMSSPVIAWTFWSCWTWCAITLKFVLKPTAAPLLVQMTTRKKKGRLSIEYEDSPPPSPGPGPGPGPFTAASSSAPGVQQSEPQQAPAASKKDPTTPSVSPCSQCACQKETQKGTRRKWVNFVCLWAAFLSTLVLEFWWGQFARCVSCVVHVSVS